VERVVKTAIAIPKADYQKIEQLRVQTGKTRSQLLVEAFHYWLKLQDQQAKEKRYLEGYAKHPEDPRLIKALVRASMKAWKKEGW
jgi:hypothetical protein